MMKSLTLLAVLAVFGGFQPAHCLDDYQNLPEGSNEEVDRVKKFTRQEAWDSTRFWLYTQKNPGMENGQELMKSHISIEQSNFNPSKPVRFLIHGFTNKRDSDFNRVVADAYLKKDDFNVIVVDWGFISGFSVTSYPAIARTIHHVGEVIADFAKFLKETEKVPFDQMYLIGHSLGAHIAGFAGKHSKPNQFRTIFGLDPAGPWFRDNAKEDRLDADDAYYVETINTNSFYGHKNALGHAAFYPNYANTQPGCPFFLPSCSHARAYEYFAESITSPQPLYARRCGSSKDIYSERCTTPERHVVMGGEPAQDKRSGIFYLHTRSSYPYRVEPANLREIVRPVEQSNGLRRMGSQDSKPIRVLICDYQNKYDAVEYCQKISDAYTRNYDVNVININWREVVRNHLLYKDVYYEDIAREVASEIRNASVKFNVPYDKIYIISQGNGALIASLAAKELAPNKVDTLYVIDSHSDVDTDAASYIESIHTQWSKANGHVNIKLDTRYGREAVDFFLETIIHPEKYIADSESGAEAHVGGEPSHHNKHGTYYLKSDDFL